MAIGYLQPEQVFQPRSHEVNDRIYIHRPELETDLERAINGTMHIIIYGDSGCGKTWLYKKVTDSMNIFRIPINLSDAARNGSITQTFGYFIAREGLPVKDGYAETKEAGIGIGVANGRLSHEDQYSIPKDDPFDVILKYGRKRTDKQKCLIVFDNLEAIFENEKLMSELGNLILLLDDEHYARYDIKFIIVGVPSGIKTYFAKVRHVATIDNRLIELTEVGPLRQGQVREFVDKGFVDLLGINFQEGLLTEYENHIMWVTAGIPQRLHEYCLSLAYLCRDNGSIATRAFLRHADKKFLRESLLRNYQSVTRLMNSRRTHVGRRNQVLYCISLIESLTFRSADVEIDLRKEFPKTTAQKALNVGHILTELSKGEDAPIRKLEERDEYEFVDPKFRLCLRAMLEKTEEENIRKLDIDDI